MTFGAKGSRSRSTRNGLPLPLKSIERVKSLAVLGVVINDRLTAADHVSRLLATCSRLLYALRVLRSQDLAASSMHDVFRSIVISRLRTVLFPGMVWILFSRRLYEARSVSAAVSAARLLQL